jgi:hypothetical protein
LVARHVSVGTNDDQNAARAYIGGARLYLCRQRHRASRSPGFLFLSRLLCVRFLFATLHLTDPSHTHTHLAVCSTSTLGTPLISVPCTTLISRTTSLHHPYPLGLTRYAHISIARVVRQVPLSSIIIHAHIAVPQGARFDAAAPGPLPETSRASADAASAAYPRAAALRQRSRCFRGLESAQAPRRMLLFIHLATIGSPAVWETQQRARGRAAHATACTRDDPTT